MRRQSVDAKLRLVGGFDRILERELNFGQTVVDLHGPSAGWNVKLMRDVHCREMTSGGLLRSLHCTQKVIAT